IVGIGRKANLSRRLKPERVPLTHPDARRRPLLVAGHDDRSIRCALSVARIDRRGAARSRIVAAAVAGVLRASIAVLIAALETVAEPQLVALTIDVAGAEDEVRGLVDVAGSEVRSHVPRVI